MNEFTLHTLDSAPLKSKSKLHKVQKTTGFIPNLLAIMAESPVTLESYLSLSDLFDNSCFTPIERHIILLSISRHRNCCYCLAAHSSAAKLQHVPTEIIDAVYYNKPFNDIKLDALRVFTLNVLKNQAWIDKNMLSEFYQSGYKQQHVLEIVLAISFKTLSNFIHHISDTPIDTQFLMGLPDSKITTCCSDSTA